MGLASAHEQVLKEKTQISSLESLQLTRNLVRIAIFSISYIRGLFPENYFEDKYLPALEMKIKKLMPVDQESRRLIDWMEKGVYDALLKKYLKTILLRLCEAADGSMIEEYSFSFSYGNPTGVSLNLSKSNAGGNQGKIFTTELEDLTALQMKSAACRMIRTLVQIMRTLNTVPSERTIFMQLHYYDETTPADYEPPFFRSCTFEDKNTWLRRPLKMKVGDVNSKHYALSLKVKSILDPCEDEVDSISGDVSQDQSSDSDPDKSSGSDASHGIDTCKQLQQATGARLPTNSKDFKSILPANGEENLKSSSKLQPLIDHDDETQDSQYEEQNLILLRRWVLTQNSNNFRMASILESLPEVSVSLMKCTLRIAAERIGSSCIKGSYISALALTCHTESELVGRLLKEGVLSIVRSDVYQFNRSKVIDMDPSQDASNRHLNAIPDSSAADLEQEEHENRLYMKALSHAIRMEHLTVPQLQAKMGRDVNQATNRKLMERMIRDGYLEVTSSNRRLGRRVLHTEEKDSKLNEILKGLQSCAIGKDNAIRILPPGDQIKDFRLRSPCERVNSVGSDLTQRTADLKLNGSNIFVSPERPSSVYLFKDVNEENALRGDTTLTENATPAASVSGRESDTFNYRMVKRGSRVDGKEISTENPDTEKAMLAARLRGENCNATVDKPFVRKASKVKEPICQGARSNKRLRFKV